MPRCPFSAQNDVTVDTTIPDCHDSRANGYSMHKAKNAMETICLSRLSEPDYFSIVWNTGPYLEAGIDGTGGIF